MRLGASFATVLPLALLPAANGSAQVRVAANGGVTISVEESCRRPATPHRPGAGGAHSAACPEETHYRRTRSFRGIAAGLSGIIPLPGVFAIELGGVYSQWNRSNGIPPESRLAFTALGKVSLPWAKGGLRAVVMAGPALTFPHERRPDLGLSMGAELEYPIDQVLGVALGAVYTHGMRNLASYRQEGEFLRQRNMVIRSALVSRFH